MATFRAFEDIEAWQEARELTRRLYKLTQRRSFRRDPALRDQIRRASVSTMSNIAEGYERDGNREFVHFLSTSKGSTAEVRSHLYVALDQGYLPSEEFAELAEMTAKISRLIGGLMSYLARSDYRGTKFRSR